MANYADILRINYPNTIWSISGNEYDSLKWNENNDVPKPSKAELDALSDDTDLEIGWEKVRRQRQRLLADSDWTQLADVPVETREKWAEYRQHLRDIPQFFDDPDFVVFPDKPE